MNCQGPETGSILTHCLLGCLFDNSFGFGKQVLESIDLRLWRTVGKILPACQTTETKQLSETLESSGAPEVVHGLLRWYLEFGGEKLLKMGMGTERGS